VLDVKSLSMGVLRNGEAGATADNLLVAAKQFGLDYGIANDFLDHAYQMIHDSWDRLAQEAGAEAIAPPAVDFHANLTHHFHLDLTHPGS
jgi:hypothetical protein